MEVLDVDVAVLEVLDELEVVVLRGLVEVVDDGVVVVVVEVAVVVVDEGTVSVSVFESLFPAVASVAVIVSGPGVVEALMCVDAMPKLLVVAWVESNLTSPDVENVTTSPLTGLLFASTTFALTSSLDVPSAGMVAKPRVSVSVAGDPAAPGGRSGCRSQGAYGQRPGNTHPAGVGSACPA